MLVTRRQGLLGGQSILYLPSDSEIRELRFVRKFQLVSLAAYSARLPLSVAPVRREGVEPSPRQVVLWFFGGLSVRLKQFAALPYRMRDDDIEILLITTRKKRRWSVPKGWPIKHGTPQQTAAIEAYEEAGVRGAVGERRVGQFSKRRVKKKQFVMCDVQIFPLEVTRQQGNWPEKQQQSRIWVAPRKAARLVKKAGLRRAIKNFEVGNDQI
jgi:8-oxo-dGTP pyrophosphatase MutT (NUDIX family)